MATYPYAYPSAAAYPPPASGFFPAYSFPSSAAYPPPLSPDPNRPPPAPPNHGDPHHCHLLYQRPTQIPNFGTGCTPYRRPISRAPQLPRSEPIDRPCVSAWPSSPHPVPPPPASPHTPKSPMELANHDLAALGATDLIRVSATIPRGAPGPWTPPPPPSGAPSSSTSGTPPFPPVQGVPDPSPLIPGADLSSSGSPPSAPPLPATPCSPPRHSINPAVGSSFSPDPARPLPDAPTPASHLAATGLPCRHGPFLLSAVPGPIHHECRDADSSISDAKLVHKHGPGILSMACNDSNRTVQATAEKSVPAKDAFLHRRQCESLNEQAHLDQQLARDRTSFDTIQGQLENLKSMVSQLANSLHKQSTHASKPEEPQHFLTVPVAGLVAPYVLDEMPTPKFCPRKFSSSLHYYQEQENPIRSTCVPEGNRNPSEQSLDEKPIQNSCVQGGSTNISLQNLDGMPQSYDFSNLTRQSIILADGTEHSYFTLPADYPLKQAVPQPVFDVYDDDATEDCSNAIVDVSASSPEQEPYEEEQLEGEQLLKCLSKPPETEQTSKYMRKAFENETHSSHSPVSATATDLLQFEAFERLPVFDVADDKTDGCLSVFGDVFASIPEQQIYEENKDVEAVYQVFEIRLPTSKSSIIWDPKDTVASSCCIMSISTCFSALRFVDLLLHYFQGNGVENRETVQWDPGIGTLSYIYIWLQGLTSRMATKKPVSSLQTPEPPTWQRQVTTGPKQWRFCCIAMHYCQIFQRCTTVSSPFDCQGIALWLITFNPP